MRIFKDLVAVTLSFSLVFTSTFAMAQSRPVGTPAPQEQLSFNFPAPAEIERMAQEVVKAREQQERTRPRWFGKLLDTKVASYFSRMLNSQADTLPQQSVDRLIEDATKVAQTFEEDDRSGEYKNFVKDNLVPFLRSLKPNQVIKSVQQVPGSIATWTLQTLVVSRMLNYISAHKDFPKKALNLVLLARHLKFGKKTATFLVLVALGHYFSPGHSVGFDLFLLGTVWFSFKAGPLGQILSAMSGFFVRPTTEQAKVMDARYTYKLEEFFNRFYDRLNPKADLTVEAGGEQDRNDRLIIAALRVDGTDFGGMTPEDQVENWEEGKSIFVTVAKRFGQLLRDTHHAGRDLMMLSWSDQTTTATLVEVLDLKRILLRNDTRAILNPYQSALLTNREYDKNAALERAIENFEGLCQQLWENPFMKEDELQVLATDIEAARDGLQNNFGLSATALKGLLAIQHERARAVTTLVTTLAIGEAKAFYSAERNRNLAPRARVIERAIRFGLGAQGYVDEHLPQVQNVMRNMGFRVSGRRNPIDLGVEQCLIMELRVAFKMPAVALSNSERCQKILFGGFENPKFDTGGGDSPINKMLEQFKDVGHRNEVISVMNQAAFTQTDPSKSLQSGAKAAIEKCLH